MKLQRNSYLNNIHAYFAKNTVSFDFANRFSQHQNVKFCLYDGTNTENQQTQQQT